MDGITMDAAPQQQQQQQSSSSSPHHSPHSQSPRTISRRNSPSLSLDLTDLPPLITPSPPTNTLLITNLMDPSIFHPASLATIRENISRTASLHSFSPLKSFRRIVASFYSTDDAIAIRQQLDGENILGSRIRVFFGAATPVNVSDKERHLAAPASDKLFFISPPPSPPHGWEMRNEEPPNKEVHADDLAVALAKLHAKTKWGDGSSSEAFAAAQQEDLLALATPVSPVRAPDQDGLNNGGISAQQQQQQQQQQNPHQRMRSGSTTIVYHPDHHGDSPALPAVMVEDTTWDEEVSRLEEDLEIEEEKKIMAHTSRPPIELME